MTLKYFTWKVEKNVSDSAYEVLRELLFQSGVQIKGIKAIRKYLQGCLEIPILQNHCCVNHHMAFNGSERHRRNCITCGTPRFWKDNPQTGDDYFPNRSAYANLKPRATYPYIPLIPRLKVILTRLNYNSSCSWHDITRLFINAILHVCQYANILFIACCIW